MLDIIAPALPDPDAAVLIAARPFLRQSADRGLLLEDVELAAIADQVGTPCWVYGAGTMRARLRRLRAALDATGLPVRLHYAVKANSHLAILRLFATEGAGADVVSGGELARARAAGIPGADIVFSGVGKSVAELQQAMAADIAQVNVESAEELDMLSALAASAGQRVRVALRVNPDVDAGTHAKITTGLANNKFGIAYADAAALYARAARLPGIDPVGVAVHIGSQISAMAPFRAAYARIATLVRDLRGAGQSVTAVDCGGGLGIAYRSETEASPDQFAAVLHETLGALDVRLAIEPGRWLVGPAGVLLSSVILTKQTAARRFVVIDAAMNDLLRPSMYDAWHGILPVNGASPTGLADVVGPVCETGDTFARDRALPDLPPGARVAILDAGAYGAVMSSCYNTRLPAAEVLVDSGTWSVIRARPRLDSLWADEAVPAHLAGRQDA